MLRLSKIFLCGALVVLIGAGTLLWRSASSSQALSAGACPQAGLRVALLARLLGIGPKFVLASSVKPSDLSMSELITPDPTDQIRCGRVPLKMIKNVVFSQPRLANGAVKSLALDLQTPASGGPRPLVIYATGGGFVAAPKETSLDLRMFVAESGFVVASIQYRTVLDSGTYKDSVADVKAAIRYLRANAKAYGIDPDHVAVWGQSAGGYLAAMAGVTGNVTTFDDGDDRSNSSVQAVVDEFGPADIGKTAVDFDPSTQAALAQPDNPVAAFVLGSPGRLADSSVAAGPANPASYISRSTPPFLILHGDDDRLVSPSQTATLHQALRAAGVDSTRYVIHGAGHGDMAFMGKPGSGLPWSTNQTMGIIVDFLYRTLDPPRS
jgi:acetyl esterase/lipase